jgi:hypothetical protein
MAGIAKQSVEKTVKPRAGERDIPAANALNPAGLGSGVPAAQGMHGMFDGKSPHAANHADADATAVEAQTGKRPAATNNGARQSPRDVPLHPEAGQSQSQDSGTEWKWPHAPATPEARQASATGTGSAARGTDSLRQRIQEEAYRIAEERGFPQGAELEHWLEAERRIAGGDGDGSASERH